MDARVVSGLVDTRLGALLDRAYLSRCTIQEATETRNDVGELVKTWTDLASHVDIHCFFTSAVSRDQRRDKDQTTSQGQWTCALRESYPAITEKMRAVVDGTVYKIVGIGGDAAGHYTYLVLELVS
jgi:head-tail adaptor